MTARSARSSRYAVPVTLAILASGAIAAFVLEACGMSDPASESANDAGSSGRDAGTKRDADTLLDAARVDGSGGDAGARDAATRDAATRDANGPGEDGDECVFNADCQSSLRCECDEVLGCSCKAGARGTGAVGASCPDDGNACASGVCLEGPPDAGFFCSDECVTNDDCVAPIPLCELVTSLGKVCKRTPPL